MSEGAAAADSPTRAASPSSATTAAAAAVAAAITAATAANESSSSLLTSKDIKADDSMTMDHDMLDPDASNVNPDENDSMTNEVNDASHEQNESNEQQISHDTTDMTISSSPAIPTSAASTPPKERHSLTLDQRRALRRWANAQLTRPSHKQCIEWFQRQYHQTISQSTVSHSLSPKYARLDGEPQLSGSRLRFGNWPEVEKLVLLWYQQMAHSGRHPTNDELGEKAKSIFSQLPRHRGDEPPEFSPGWIHRFKKRYGLLVRRQRRQSGSSAGNVMGGGPSDDPASDISYLVDAVPRFLHGITADTNPVAIRDTIITSLGIEPSIATCTRVRDEIARYNDDAAALAPLADTTTESQASAAAAAAAAVAVAAAAAAAVGAASPSAGFGSSDPQHHQQHHQLQGSNGDVSGALPATASSTSVYHPHPDEDPEIVLQNALRQLQQEEDAAAEAEAAEALAASASVQQPPATPSQGGLVMATSSPTAGSSSQTAAANRPIRCPFCVNQRMLRTIKDAVDHMSTHVEVP